MKPHIDKKWRKKNPSQHKSIKKKRIEDKQRKKLLKEIKEYEETK